jgi:hypothetical protein
MSNHSKTENLSYGPYCKCGIEHWKPTLYLLGGCEKCRISSTKVLKEELDSVVADNDRLLEESKEQKRLFKIKKKQLSDLRVRFQRIEEAVKKFLDGDDCVCGYCDHHQQKLREAIAD